MSIAFNFQLDSSGTPKVPHILRIKQSERDGKFFSWDYFKKQGEDVKSGQVPEASGNAVHYGMNQSEFDLYTSSGKFATLTLKGGKSMRTISKDDVADFKSFTGSVDRAKFTKKTREIP